MGLHTLRQGLLYLTPRYRAWRLSKPGISGLAPFVRLSSQATATYFFRYFRRDEDVAIQFFKDVKFFNFDEEN